MAHIVKPNQAELVYFQSEQLTPFFLHCERQVKDLAQSQQIAAGVWLRMDECLWADYPGEQRERSRQRAGRGNRAQV